MLGSMISSTNGRSAAVAPTPTSLGRDADEDAVEVLRAREYARLDAQDHVYLDYAGGGLYADSQLREHQALLRNGIFGNPHSNSPTSRLSTGLAEQARRAVLAFFSASPDEYTVVFTANASAALRLVGESYPFTAGSQFLLTADNHNSVNGIREFARSRDADVVYVPLHAPDLRHDGTEYSPPSIVRRPAGTPLRIPGPVELFRRSPSARLGERGAGPRLGRAPGRVRIRADEQPRPVAMAPRFRRHLLVQAVRVPDGDRIADRAPRGARPPATPVVRGRDHRHRFGRGAASHARPTTRSVSRTGRSTYLGLPAIEIGLRHLASVGMPAIHGRAGSMTRLLLEQMSMLRHPDGAPLVRLYGPTDDVDRGGTVAFNLLDRAAASWTSSKVEASAADRRISVRTGCFCNPGASEAARGLTAPEMERVFELGRTPSVEDFRRLLPGRALGAVRVSVGIATTQRDISRFRGAFLQDQADDRR